MKDAGEVYVVGSNGFLGSSACRLLQRNGHSVVPINKENFESEFNPTNFNSDLPATVIWLASKVNPSTAESNPILAKSELDEFKEVVEACSGKISNFVFASSGGTVYSSDILPFTEDSEASGVNAYGKLKRSMEKILIESGLPFTILRISNVYGPGQVVKNSQGIIAALFDAALNGNKFDLYGPDTNKRDFLFIDDLMKLLELVVEREVSSGVINVGSGQAVEISKLLEAFSSLTDLRPTIHPTPARAIDRAEFWLDISKAKKSLGWLPEHSLEAGLEATWKNLQKQRVNQND
jgi:UDP-glucose 4-epimerase